MMVIFTKEQEKYINPKDGTCVRATTPPEILKSLEKINAYHFKMVGGPPLIRVI